jgi:hypothetical protein
MILDIRSIDPLSASSAFESFLTFQEVRSGRRADRPFPDLFGPPEEEQASEPAEETGQSEK